MIPKDTIVHDSQMFFTTVRVSKDVLILMEKARKDMIKAYPWTTNISNSAILDCVLREFLNR